MLVLFHEHMGEPVTAHDTHVTGDIGALPRRLAGLPRMNEEPIPARLVADPGKFLDMGLVDIVTVAFALQVIFLTTTTDATIYTAITGITFIALNGIAFP